MAKGDDIEERLIDFSVRIVKLCLSLPHNPVGKHMAGQLVRSGTAPALNYAEARAAESRRDFIHKMRIAHKELNETLVNIKIVQRSELIPPHLLSEIETECDQLCRIFNKSIQTARTNN